MGRVNILMIKLDKEQKEAVKELIKLELMFKEFPKNAEDDPELGCAYHSCANTICDLEKELGLDEISCIK